MSEQSARILIVEDAANWRNTLEAILKRIGYLVSTASNKKQAKDALDSGLFDLAIVDVRLGEGASNDESGFEIVKEAWAKHMAARFIVISGYSMRDQVCLALGNEIPYQVFDKADISSQHFRETVAKLISEVR